MKRAVFLDRDGVINLDRGYVHRWEEFQFVPGAVEAMAQLTAAGWQIVIVTNQSGIARGYYTESQFFDLTRSMVAALAEHRAAVAGVYHCPHHPKGNVAEFAHECDCRKPRPGLILRAAAELRIALKESVLVGDKPSDIRAARAAGIGQAFMVRSDNEDSVAHPDDADATFDSLAHCVNRLLGS